MRPPDSSGGRDALTLEELSAEGDAPASSFDRAAGGPNEFLPAGPLSTMCKRVQASIVRWPGILVCHLAVHFACPAVMVDSSNLPPPSK